LKDIINWLNHQPDGVIGPICIILAIIGASISYWGTYKIMNWWSAKRVRHNFSKVYNDPGVKKTFPLFAEEYSKHSNAFFNASVKPGNDMAEDVKKVLTTLRVPSFQADQMVAIAMRERTFATPADMLEYIFRKWGRGNT
jgi:hypothetical protein